MSSEKKFKAKEIIDALYEMDGVVVQAARMLGCSARTIYNYANEYTTVREAMQDARQDTYAEAQGYLVEMMRDRDHKDHKWAVDRILKTYGEQVDDGVEWIEKIREEHTGTGGGPVRVFYDKPQDADE